VDSEMRRRRKTVSAAMFTFDVTMHDASLVTVVETIKELFRETLDLVFLKVHTGCIHQPHQIMIHELKHNVHATLATVVACFLVHATEMRGPPVVVKKAVCGGVDLGADDLLQLHNVFVIHISQQLDLTNRGDREPFLLVPHPKLLHRDQLVGVTIFRFVDAPAKCEHRQHRCRVAARGGIECELCTRQK
jgi:hypothetical protein